MDHKISVATAGGSELRTSYIDCVKSVCIQSFSGPYLVRMWENAYHKSSKYVHTSRNDAMCLTHQVINLKRLDGFGVTEHITLKQE